MSSIVDTICLMQESVHAISGQRPQRLYLGEKMREALDVEVPRTTTYDIPTGKYMLLGMEIMDVSNDPWALAIVGHVVQQALPL